MRVDGLQPFLHQKLCRTLTFIDQEPCQNKNLYQCATSKSLTKPHCNTQPLRSSNQLSSGYRSATESQSQRRFSSFSENNKGGYCARNSGLNYSPNARIGNGSDRLSLKEKRNMHGELEAMADLTCGPRGQRRKSVLNVPAVDKRMLLSVRREEYNLEDFQTEYGNAKFYVIKPISEDDTHKSIKYNVWSSTPIGNKKLDAAFHDSQNETSEEEAVCPIFLFFSVNRSGQFVGLAEMIGKVDFAKNLNFWQSDKWNGFFPVKWHIIKDIPHTQLRHIIIENNDNEPVTRTRDTQEIGYRHGSEMLRIFKNYTAKTSLLDDFNFYENREHSLRARRNNMPAIRTEKHERVGQQTIRGFTTNNFSDSAESIIRRTQKLSVHVTQQ
ncbi:YTH domain-containing protein [Heracleum sosnowskyi]|uniref:YTH domain-containing family protein n=1 Tax=Heracleum sosnowskyi TaxID=360622 RepID=A0AAD8IHD9_9APIA|nr:YTH domain-containing protein [Heracleum sosnowskyi]